MKMPLNKPKRIIITKSSKGGGTSPGQGIMKQAFMALVIFLLLVSLYSLFSDMSKSIEEVSLSELTQEISTGNI